MNTEFKILRDKIIEDNSETKTLFGMNETVKRLMGMMYYYEKSMTLDDMTEMLGMSKASMSNAVRELVEMDLVQKIHVKGERKVLYKVEDDNYECFIKYFCFQWRKLLIPKATSIKKQIAQLNRLKRKEGIDKDTVALIDKDLEKLQAALDYIDWLDRVTLLFESHEIFDYVPKGESARAKIGL
ncbi:GbsR/MarR family transcriptional regulator [Aquibacillus koreensis]|uniref:HTH-type transcriptional regulator n=1 Tax=Aquibacillus koreensis TaxID=279446 RepID=A0A9X3WJ37_9BACI|nr:GbsR/MarR family transcriptional regulator [Aquibacillus koreensis]MCT2536067.1 GbsR/MarR family transcriptional regulator [Aquibacillus koreensis]MDC3419490.1 GbsR/MarR family transcriptional regulator [Aquibacillus koreensis]